MRIFERLEYLDYEKIKNNYLTLITKESSFLTEIFVNDLRREVIINAIESNPDSKIIISGDDYCEEPFLEFREHIIFCNEPEVLLDKVLSPQKFSLVILLGKTPVLSGLKRICQINRIPILAILQKSRVTNEMSYISSMIFEVSELESVVQVYNSKNRTGFSFYTKYYSLDSEEKKWLDDYDKKDFFELRRNGFSGKIIYSGKVRKVKQLNCYEYFKEKKVPRIIKKIILEKCITTIESDLICVDFTIFNLYDLLSNWFGQKMNVDVFVQKVRNDKFKNDLTLSGLDFSNIYSLLPQSKVYEWFKGENEVLMDSLVMYKNLSLKGVSFNEKVKDINELHDKLIVLSLEHDSKNYVEIKEQKNIAFLNEKSVVLKKAEYQIYVPFHEKDFLLIGTKLQLCIRSSWYWEGIRSGTFNIFLLKEKNGFCVCVKVDSNLNIIEIKGYKNSLICDELKKELEDRIQLELENIVYEK